MLYCDRIDKSKGIDPTKSYKSREYMICHYFFFNHGFKFQDYICNGCRDLTMLSVNMNSIAIITSEAINLLKNSVLKNCGYI